MKMYDRDFIKRLREGDSDTIREFMREFSQPLYVFYVRKGVSPTVAEDLTYDCISKICCEAILQYKHFNFRAWVYQIAHNLFIDYYRKQKLETVSLDELGYENSALEQADLSDSYVYDSIDLIADAIDQLSYDDRTVIKARIYKGLDYDLIASKLSISPEAARKRYSRAIQKLRYILVDAIEDTEYSDK